MSELMLNTKNLNKEKNGMNNFYIDKDKDNTQNANGDNPPKPPKKPN